MVKKDKIALVVHRYGREINGGAEDHCRLLAGHLLPLYAVEILTSCSKGIRPWDNWYEEGSIIEDEVEISRFHVEDASGYPVGAIERSGPFCPGFESYIIENHKKYKAVIYITYSHYFSYVGLRQNFRNAIFLPTAHDEAWLRTPFFAEAFQNAKGFLFNSVEERELIERVYDVGEIPSRTTCFGLNVNDYNVQNGNLVPEDYIIYAGRISNWKNFRELNDYFLRYKDRNKSELKLVVIGKIDNNMTVVHHDDIIFKGFVTDEEKKILIKKAKLLVLPSKTESLSIVMLESFACKRPVLVNGLCDVLKGQCERSNGGLYYTNYDEFEAELQYLLEHDDVRKIMGENGYQYVRINYTWDIVVRNVVSLINEVNGEKEKQDAPVNIKTVESEISVKSIVKVYGCQKSDKGLVSAREQYLKRIIGFVSRHRQVVIVGSGMYGTALYKLLQNHHIDAKVYFSDNNFEKYQDGVLGKKVYSLEESTSLFPGAYFVVTAKYYIFELLKQLINLGVSMEQIGYYVE